MKIIIAGSGDVGYHLAKNLAQEKHDIALIDIDQEKLKQAANKLDVVTVKGYSISYNALEEANVSQADMLIAVTSSEETNIATAIIAKHLGVKKTIARVSNPEFTDITKKGKLDLKNLGIDEVIYPEGLATKEIEGLLRQVATTDNFNFEEGKLSLIGITIDKESLLLGKSNIEMAYLNPDHNFITIAILRGEDTLIPRGETRFELGDHAYFIAEREGVERVLDLTGKKRLKIKYVMILGGSKTGENAARVLSKNYKVQIIEKDKNKCIELSDQLSDVLVVHGDGRDISLLNAEGISDMDAFIAVTGNTETNIISCLVAKRNGVKKTISLVENIDYIHLSQNLGVDTMINKKLIAANSIIRYLRQGGVISMTSIPGVEAEILEYQIQNNSKIISQQLKELNFPRGAIVGGVIRKGNGYAATGDSRFLPGDRVVVLSTPECIQAVGEFFDEE